MGRVEELPLLGFQCLSGEYFQTSWFYMLIFSLKVVKYCNVARRQERCDSFPAAHARFICKWLNLQCVMISVKQLAGR